jgi:hypothetical protein
MRDIEKLRECWFAITVLLSAVRVSDQVFLAAPAFNYFVYVCSSASGVRTTLSPGT